jgi:nuclear GTP-binding protein
MVKKKGKSKRTTLKDKYKIQRRVVETHRKNRKQAKRDAKAGIVRHDKKKKDPGIPNSWPFKQELLQDIKRSNERIEQKKAEEKERRAALRKDPTSLTELMVQANQQQNEFDARTGNTTTADEAIRSSKESHGQQSRRAYLRELKKVIEASDVILQVLDARDPLGTRIHPAIEAGILSHFDKRMVLVMNKIDLIPKANVSEWLTFLRKSHPTVALKAGTTQSRSAESGKSSGIGQTKGESALSSSSAVGVDGLLQLLKNYARSAGESKRSKSCISVGIIGYPNVGKSSILNSLKRFRAVGVSPRPGHTTAMQEVVLDKNIRLIDSPGVVFDDEENAGAGAVLRNSVDADSISDPVPAVEELLNRATVESIMMTYNVPAFPKGDVMTFLAMAARSKGKVLKGGIPDKVMAARMVLKDWNKGKIPYYSVPPSSDGMAVDVSGGGGEAVLVSRFSEEFDVNKILAAHDAELMEGLEEKDEMDFVAVSSGAVEGGKNADRVLNYLKGDEDQDSSEGSDEDMEEDEDDAVAANKRMEDAEDFDFGD